MAAVQSLAVLKVEVPAEDREQAALSFATNKHGTVQPSYLVAGTTRDQAETLGLEAAIAAREDPAVVVATTMAATAEAVVVATTTAATAEAVEVATTTAATAEAVAAVMTTAATVEAVAAVMTTAATAEAAEVATTMVEVVEAAEAVAATVVVAGVPMTTSHTPSRAKLARWH